MQESSWKGIKFLRRMEIPKSNNKNVFHPAEKFDTLFYYVIFEDAWVVFSKQWLVYSWMLIWKRKASSKNNANTYLVRWQ